MLDVLSGFGSLLSGFFLFLLKTFVIALAPFVIMFFVFFLYYRYIKKIPLPKRQKKPTYKRESILKRLLIDFPKRMALDRFTLNPDRYPDTGIYIFEGEQGSGKTVATVHFVYEQLKKYPMAEFSSNIDIIGQKDLLEDWQQIVDSDNGIFGQINVIDEIQNWFNSNESKNVPIEFVGEICQQRKQAKCVIGTTQRFNRMSKQLRQETTFLMRPITIFGALTIVRQYKPTVDSDGVLKQCKLRRMYFFLHTEELRNAYDTYAKVQRLSLKGFQPRSEQIFNNTTITPTKP